MAHHANIKECDIRGLAVCGQGPFGGSTSAVLAAGDDEDGHEDRHSPRSTTRSQIRQRQAPDRVVEHNSNLLEYYRILDSNEYIGDDSLPEVSDEERAEMLRKVMKYFIPPLERSHGFQ